MDLRINFTSGVPIYVQLMEQIKHAVETGAVRAGEQLPTIRKVAEELAMNPNTVARAYRELEHKGVIEVRHGSGAYILEPGKHSKATSFRRSAEILRPSIGKAIALGLSEPELRRVFESELSRLLDNAATPRRKN
jgi:GntR family transcriptional regulator